MSRSLPSVLIACNPHVRDVYLAPADLARLEAVATWDWFSCTGGGIQSANDDPAARAGLRSRLGAVDVLIVCHGAPLLDDDLLEAAPRLRFIGELEGDRFASRIDLQAAWKRRIRTVDTTNASSYPVSEWALALMLIALRNGSHHFRRILQGETPQDREATARTLGTLTGRRVGLVGGGHMARRLMKLLQPFETEIWVHDPYLPPELPEALGFTLTGLNNLFAHCDVVVCLAPLTPGTKRLIGAEQLNLLRSGTVFVNVSRGPIVDPDALIERLRKGDITAGLDVFDPEPIPPNSEIIQLPNVFLSPHIGYYAADGRTHFFRLMVDELERFFAGHETWYNLTPSARANRLGQ